MIFGRVQDGVVRPGMTVAVPLNPALSLSLAIDEVKPFVCDREEAHLGLFIAAASSDELALLTALNIDDEALILTDDSPH